ncbi:MAG: hypothetical protein AB7V58_10520 [Solirubrobacterales bacterium]
MASSEATRDHAGPLALARALVVTFGGSALLSAAVLAAGCELGRAALAGRRPARAAVWTAAAAVAYETTLAPWMRGWGSTAAERRRELPGDDALPAPGTEITQAVTIAAPPEAVWPWLAQIGQDRGGFYSYEWLENLAGCEMRNADRVHPEWQHREVGEPVTLHPAAPGLPVTRFEPGRAIGLEGWGVFLVEPAPGGSGTRLIAYGRIPRGSASVFYRSLLEIPHFVMQRAMLLGIKRRVESAVAAE